MHEKKKAPSRTSDGAKRRVRSGPDRQWISGEPINDQCKVYGISLAIRQIILRREAAGCRDGAKVPRWPPDQTQAD
jgi:hypothetical protein